MPHNLQKADRKSKSQIPDSQILFLQIARMEKHQRLKIARERRFRTAKEAATSLGVPYGTYSGHEAGSRGIKEVELALYARRFRVPIGWLAFGQGEMTDEAPSVAIAGSVGADSRPDAVLFAEQGEGSAFNYTAPVPPNYREGIAALEVRGNSMRNIARDGWLIYYDQSDVRQPPTDDLVGELCICWLEDGRVLFKELQFGMGDGFWDLESSNAPTIRDVVIEKAALVTSIIPRGKRPNTDTLSPDDQDPTTRQRRTPRS